MGGILLPNNIAKEIVRCQVGQSSQTAKGTRAEMQPRQRAKNSDACQLDRIEKEPNDTGISEIRGLDKMRFIINVKPRVRGLANFVIFFKKLA